MREPVQAREPRRHKEQIAILFGPASQLLQIVRHLPVIPWINRSESLRPDQSWHFAHNVKFEDGISPRGQQISAGLRVQRKQMLCSGQCSDIRPSLIDLFNNIESMTFDRMKSDRLELHTSEQIQRVAGLRGNPGLNLRGGIADLA
jgi:hypothetical protein